MKKSRLIALLLVVVLAVSLLSSCALFGGAGDVKKLLDDEGTFEVKAAASSATDVSSLTGYTTRQSSEGDLVVLSKLDTDYSGMSTSTSYIVYNVKTGSTLKSFTNYTSTGSSHTGVTIGEVNEVSYFYTVYTYYGSDETTYTTELFDANGNMLTSVNKNITPSTVEGTNLIKFDDMYFEAKDGALNRAFEATPFKAIPDIFAGNDEYYYAKDGNFFAIYDKQFEKLATCELPEYYDNYECGVLPGGNLLIQYTYVVDFFADKYDVLDTDEMVKYNVVTLILTAKGKVKEVKADFVIEGIYEVDAEMVAENVLNPKKFEGASLVQGYKIEDNRIAYEFSGFINKSGKVTELPELEGEGVLSIMAVAANRWVVITETYSYYLINEEGEILGAITEDVDTCGNYLVADGKIYDWSLNVLLDYEAAGYDDGLTALGGNIILTKTYEYSFSYLTSSGYDSESREVSDVVLFNGTTTTILDGTQTYAARVNSYNPSATTKAIDIVGDCYVITTTSRVYSTSGTTTTKGIELFNENAQSLKTLTNLASVSVEEVYEDEDNGLLLKVTSQNPYYGGAGSSYVNPTNYAYWLVK